MCKRQNTEYAVKAHPSVLGAGHMHNTLYSTCTVWEPMKTDSFGNIMGQILSSYKYAFCTWVCAVDGKLYTRTHMKRQKT
jgi:hypothetical protein